MRAVCSGTRGRGCCGWSDIAKPPEITAPTPLSTLRLTHSPTVSGPKWDSLARRGPAHGRTSKAQAQRALGLRGTADLLGILVRLGLNDAGRLLSDAQRHLG